ncbi:unnamed protein product [Ectocarpus sp. CCAP 1310/34]|nr:unnamed protein product [Ectocarpus sp. CCAP 1310/34]
MNLEEFGRQLDVLESLVGQERPTQREDWRRKLRELRNEHVFLRDQLGRFDQGRRKVGQEAKEREELLARRHAALPSSVMDAYAEEGSSLLRSRRMVGDYLQTGQASLTSLVEQRSRLKARENAHRKVLDMANILGLSNSILRVSDRRQAVDRLLVLGGIIVTSAFLWWMWGRRVAS